MRELLTGAAIAAAAGLLMGAAAKPDLIGDDRPAGPQMLASWNTSDDAGPFADDSAAFAHYGAKIPDYVFGTDMKKATSIYPTAALPPPMKLAALDDPPQETPDGAQPPRASDLDDAPTPASYPSVDGGHDEAAQADLTPTDAPAA